MRHDESPFLLEYVGRGQPQSVAATTDADTSIIDVAVCGRWTRGLKITAAEVLRKCLAQHPAGIVVDLHDLGDPDGYSASLWTTAHGKGAGMSPPVPVVASLPATTPLAGVLHRRGARWFLPMYESPLDARAALIQSTARTERLTLRLDPEPAAARLARDLVGEACTAWELPSLRQVAPTVMSELVLNAAEHAGTPIDVTVTRRPSGMHLAVYDRRPALPRLPVSVRGDPGEPERYGRGLHLVHAVTTAWGALPTRDGKMTWAILLVRGIPGRGNPPSA